MVHKHSVRDTGAHFTIDPYTRQIKNDSANKTTIVQYDHNSERLTFEMPLYIDGHAMTLCDLIEIHYINIATDGKSQNPGVYEVDDITADGDKAVFTWLIKQESTQLAGSLNFFIVFKCTENGVTVYRWGTEICKTLAVSDGMDNGEAVLTEYPDILAQWKEQLFSASATAVVNVTTAEASALANIEAAGEAKKQSVLDSIPDEYEALSALADSNYRNKAGAIVVDAEGESIAVNDASEYPLQNLKVFGRSTQDGTPTPEAPVDIVSVTNPVVRVCAKNLAKSNRDGEITSAGITVTQTKDSSEIIVSGTATNATSVTVLRNIPLASGRYVISVDGLNVIDAVYDRLYITDSDGTLLANYVRTDEAKTIEVVKHTEVDVTIIFAENSTYNNSVINIQIELGEVATEYEPYIEAQTIETTHTLHGIPVSSGGNYTDADGQQWICDEIDLARGVYVKRIKEFVLAELNPDTWNTWGVNNYTEGITGFYHYFTDAVTKDFVLCNIGTYSIKAWGGLDIGVSASADSKYLTISIANSNLADVSSAELAINSLKMLIANTNAKMYAVIAPIETPLSNAEINAFRSLHTNKPNTTILNDAGAYMSVSYIADTKTYIDNKFAELG